MNPVNERLLKLSAVVSGFAAMITQVLALRESMGIFQGNELVIGLVLGSWMFLTALGAWLGDRLPTRSMTLVYLLLLMAIFMIVSVWGSVFARALVMPRGVMPDVVSIIFIVMATLGPYCIVSGMMFPVLVRVLSDSRGWNMTNTAYSLESAGSIIGGLLFSLVLIMLMDTTWIVAIVSAVILLTAASLCIDAGKKALAVMVAFTALGWMAAILLADPEVMAIKGLLKNQDLLELRDTPYGKLSVSRHEGQVNIYENGIPVHSGEDVPDSEESVHFALLQADQPEKVLMISGGLNGALSEALKYPGMGVVYVESDPWLVRLAARYIKLPGKDSVKYISRDGRSFIRESHDNFDAILVNLPAPLSAGINRYYTLEFFRESRAILKPGGVFCISLPGGNQYLGEESRKLHSSLLCTLREVFPQVRLVPGQRHYFLASDRALDKPYQPLVAAKPQLRNKYVNESYLRDELMDRQAGVILASLDPGAPVNSDLHPYSYSLYVQYWLSHFKTANRLIPYLLIALLGIFFAILPPVRLGLFMSGLSAATYEFMMMVVLQVALGNIYWLAGLVFAAFMAGLASGSALRDKLVSRSDHRIFISLQVFLAGLLLVTALALPQMMTIGTPILILLIFILVIGSGAITGLQFAVAAVFGTGPAGSGKNYAADLAGSAIGIWLVTVFILPRAGIINTCLVLFAMNLFMALIIRLRLKFS